MSESRVKFFRIIRIEPRLLTTYQVNQAGLDMPGIAIPIPVQLFSKADLDKVSIKSFIVEAPSKTDGKLKYKVLDKLPDGQIEPFIEAI